LARLRAGGVPVIDASFVANPADDPRYGIQGGDGHPTPLAHHLRASLIDQYLKANMPEILSAPK
jgi:hypothetical protein